MRGESQKEIQQENIAKTEFSLSVEEQGPK